MSKPTVKLDVKIHRTMMSELTRPVVALLGK